MEMQFQLEMNQAHGNIMKDKDKQLIWEQYKSPGREGDPKKSIPFPDGKGEMGEKEAADGGSEYEPTDVWNQDYDHKYAYIDIQRAIDHPDFDMFDQSAKQELFDRLRYFKNVFEPLKAEYEKELKKVLDTAAAVNDRMMFLQSQRRNEG